jgi:hypothetical protein
LTFTGESLSNIAIKIFPWFGGGGDDDDAAAAAADDDDDDDENRQ